MTKKIIQDEQIFYEKPIIKWIGGKTQIIDTVIENFPNEINNYHELFLGGGSVLIGLLSLIESGNIKLTGNIYAYDLNPILISVYQNIQNNHELLYEYITTLIEEFYECPDEGIINRKPNTLNDAKLCKENYYYWVRKNYNSSILEDNIMRSAMFIFLNKTCFRGVFRVGPNGFNVPYGHYDNPEIINKSHLDRIHNLIQNVEFKCCDFSCSLLDKQLYTDDFIYLDPPYAPENKTSFVGYTENGFDINKHNELFEFIHNIPCKIMMSNSDVDLVNSNFNNEKYNKEIISCRRSINSKKPESKTNEVIIKNY
jgi:DNA adenine methylase